MPTLKREPQENMKQHQRETQQALIGEQVLHSLGEPANLIQVQVRQLWEDRFRVNVLVGQDIASIKIANSYFVIADSDGNVTESNPKITRQY